MKPSDFAQDLANKIITQLAAGTAPWQRPWAEGQAYAPYNPVTGNRYRGINFVALLSSNYTDPRWMTYKQAQAQGWQVSAGEKSTRIQHWVWEEEQARLDKNGKPLLDEKGNVSKETVRLERPKVILAAVFNAEQIEGISTLETGRQYNWDPLEKAEKLLSASNARIKHSSKREHITECGPIQFTCRIGSGLRMRRTIIRPRCTNSRIGRDTLNKWIAI